MRCLVFFNSLFVAVTIAIISFIIIIPAGVRAKFDHHHEDWTKTQHDAKEDPAGASLLPSSVVTKPNNHNNKNNKVDRTLTYSSFCVGASAVQPPPCCFPSSYDIYLGSGGRVEGGGGRAGPQSSKKHYTGGVSSSTTVSPPKLAEEEQGPPMYCFKVEFEVKSNYYEPDMTMEVIAPDCINGNSVVNLHALNLNKDLTIFQEGFLPMKMYNATDDCFDIRNQCYVLIICDTEQKFGFGSGYAKITIYGQEVYKITDKQVWCGFGAQCGNAGNTFIEYANEATFEFDTKYEYAAIGACTITTTKTQGR